MVPVAALACFVVGCDDEESTTGPSGPPPKVVNVVVDTNRDGVLDGDDETNEEAWGIDHGAIFLANIDDDDLNGMPDAEDEWVNGEFDAYDMAVIKIAAWPQVPDGATGTLTIDEVSVWHTRVHEVANPDEPNRGLWQFTPIAGSLGPCGAGGVPDCTQVGSIPISTDQIRTGATFAIEGVRPIGITASQGWSGTVGLGFSAVGADAAPILTEANPVDGIDWAQMRVAPWLLLGNMSATTRVYSSHQIGALVNDLTQSLGEQQIEYVQTTNWGDIWTEDFFETGYMSMPADGYHQGMLVGIPRPWGRGSNSDANHPISWLRASHQGVDMAALLHLDNLTWMGDSYDSFGNHDLIPPYVNGTEVYPLGRIIYGTQIRTETRVFYEGQIVQGPPLVVDTSWLAVGHVDEALSYVPADTDRGWKLMRASPDLCRTMMMDWQSQGHGGAIMLEGKMGYIGNQYTSVAISIDEMLADADFATWNQASQADVDAMVDMITASAGLGPDEIIEIPFYYERFAPGQMLAYHPGTVNSLVTNDAIHMPDPFGPNINGVDGFKQDLLDRLGPGSGLGSEGQGMTVYFIDDWEYHIAMGEVHCATNQEGPPGEQNTWWEGLR